MQSIKTLEELMVELASRDVLVTMTHNSATNWMVALQDPASETNTATAGETPMAALAGAIFKLNIGRDNIGLDTFSPIKDAAYIDRELGNSILEALKTIQEDITKLDMAPPPHEYLTVVD